MKVAWITHQLPNGSMDHGPGLLKGLYAGGAEMSTAEMIAAAPDGVEVFTFHPESGLPDPAFFDRVVVGATERLTGQQVQKLIQIRPILWVRSIQHAALAPLFRAARTVVWPSHGCAAWHEWAPGDYKICPAPLDTSLIPRDTPKEDFALWAGRNHPQKGRVNARLWAWERGIPFVELTDAPREVVLEHMGRARWFVHLPKGVFDPCPRTLIEAELAGCEVVTNRLAGRVEVAGQGPEVVREHIRQVPSMFWGWVRDS